MWMNLTDILMGESRQNKGIDTKDSLVVQW